MNMPFLRSRLNLPNSVCRTSLGDAPTESRPNHSAMLGGLPEELSNFWVLWRRNAREFDHLLKRGSFGFSIGAPDLAPFFFGPRVIVEAFPLPFYRNADTRLLDDWIFDTYKKILHDTTLEGRVRADGAVFFLHLPAVDTTGHRHGALSEPYVRAVNHCDQTIKRIEKLTEDFFGDNGTLFIFTSDHGFPNIGGHGSKEYHSRRAPFVAWGVDALHGIPDHEECRKTLHQRQISSFAAGTLGKLIPVNNVMRFPLELYSGTEEQKTRIMVANYGQLVNEYCAQSAEVQRKSLVLGWTLRSTCERERNNLRQIERLFNMKNTPLEKIDQYIEYIQWRRSVLFLLKGIIAAIPFILGCILIFIVAFNKDIHYEKLAKEVNNRPLSLLFALLFSVAWYIFGYRSYIVLPSSVVVALLVQKAKLEGFESQTMFNAMCAGIGLALCLWSSKLTLIIPLAVIFQLASHCKTDALIVAISSSLIYGINLFYRVDPSLRDLVPLIVSPIVLSLLGRKLLQGKFIWLQRLDLSMVSIAMASTYCTRPNQDLTHVFNFGFASMLTLQVVLYFVFKPTSGSQPLACYLTIIAFSFVILAFVDPIFILYKFLVLYHAFIINENAQLTPGSRSVSLIFQIMLSAMGPFGMVAAGDVYGYYRGPVGEQLIDWRAQLPLAAFFTLYAWSYLHRQLDGLSQEVKLGKMTIKYSVMAAAVASPLLMALFPRDESWLETVSTVAKCFFVTCTPLLVSVYIGIIYRRL